MFVVAKRGIDAGVEFEQAADQPEEVRKAVEVGDDLRVDVLARFVHPNDATLGAAADRPGDVVGGRG